MLFHSISYAVFLPLVCLAYYLVSHRLRWLVLLGFSYYFYMSWNPELIVLILFTTAVSWASGLALGRLASPKLKRAVLWLGCGACLAVLLFFKYFDFFSESIHTLFEWFGLSVNPPLLHLLLPMGISFYTFQTLSYIIDVYRGTMEAEPHFGYYALYVSFFPQLVAGPIERADRLLPQFKEKHSFSTAQTSEGLRKIGVGLFKKIVIADTLAPYVDTVYNRCELFGGLSLVWATLLFAVQIYCDFSGYSDIAVGSARLLGFELMENFHSPYFSKSISEFWSRWHISLSKWLEDYIFTPFVWSAPNAATATYWGFLLTFLASGFWHGASWNYVLWGLLHGIYRAVGAGTKKRRKKLLKKLGVSTRSRWFSVYQNSMTFSLVTFSYIFFRANSLHDLFYILTNLTRGLNPLRLFTYITATGISLWQAGWAVLLVGILASYDYIAYHKGDPLLLICRAKPWQRYLFYFGMGAFLVAAISFRPLGTQADFIYFQF